MPEEARVWMVRLDRAHVEDDVRGTLSLEVDAVVFTEAVSTIESRFPLEHMQKPKRVRGSPILLVTHRTNEEVQRIAFYFSQPPPLRPPEPGSTSLPGRGVEARPMGAFGAMRRSSKRRHMRGNLGYLTTANASYRQVIQEWVAEIGARLDAG
jgi:hypothetical protein